MADMMRKMLSSRSPKGLGLGVQQRFGGSVDHPGRRSRSGPADPLGTMQKQLEQSVGWLSNKNSAKKDSSTETRVGFREIDQNR